MVELLSFEGVTANHPVARLSWPFLIPIHKSLISASFELRDFAPFEPRLGRMAYAVRDLITDAELGLLSASPEQRVRRVREATGGV